MAEKLKVKELGPDQRDGLIYCEELFVKLFAVPVCHSPTSKKCHQPPLEMKQSEKRKRKQKTAKKTIIDANRNTNDKITNANVMNSQF